MTAQVRTPLQIAESAAYLVRRRLHGGDRAGQAVAPSLLGQRGRPNIRTVIPLSALAEGRRCSAFTPPAGSPVGAMTAMGESTSPGASTACSAGMTAERAVLASAIPLARARHASVDVELVAFRVLHPDRVVVEPFLSQCARDGRAEAF